MWAKTGQKSSISEAAHTLGTSEPFPLLSDPETPEMSSNSSQFTLGMVSLFCAMRRMFDFGTTTELTMVGAGSNDFHLKCQLRVQILAARHV